MDNIYVLNQDFSIEGIIDEYVSIIWRPAYSDIGDFEIYVGATDKALNLLTQNRYVVRSSDIAVSNGVTTYKKVMIIKNLDLITDVENGNFLTVTGRELKYLLHQRVVWKQADFNEETVEAIIRQLVNDNAVSPENTNRVIPNMVLGSELGDTETISKQVAVGEYLDTTILNLCSTYNIGWEMYISGGELVFNVYRGIDRSYDQTVRPYVVFSDKFDNIYNTEYQLNTESFANTSRVGGESQGSAKELATVNDDNAGLDRYEIYTDASDISRTVHISWIDPETGERKEADVPMALSQYLPKLIERGKEDLVDKTYTEGFSGEVLSDVAYKYGKDFYLGDLVTVINEYGITKNVRVLSAIESEDEKGIKLLPQFNI